MTTNGVDLLIHSRPLWHQAAPKDVPVSVKQVYGVLGRRGQKWESILSLTDDLHIARRTMEAANTASIFDRIVITQGYSVDNAPAGKWETIECAVPQHRVVTGDSFTALLHKLQTQTANINPEGLYQHSTTPLIGEKHTYTWSLVIAYALAALNMNAPALIGVAAFAMMEILFLKDTRPVEATRMRKINLFRNWFYALLNGGVLALFIFR